MNPRSRTWLLLLLFFVGSLVFRVGTQHRQGWVEGDDMCLAAGVGAVVNGNGGPAYRYGPQWGYYHLVATIARALGDDGLASVPDIMLALGALAAAVFPLLAVWAFPDVLLPRERLLLAALLFVNPILWTSGQYGNTAMPSGALAVGGIVALSRSRSLQGLWGGWALVCLGVLVRADAVLLGPVAAWVAFGRPISWFRQALGLLPVGALAALYLYLLTHDPRMAHVTDTVSEHVVNKRFATLFWEYWIWSLSPAAFVFMWWGMRTGLGRRDRYLWTCVIWTLPVLGFYFPATTTPRYFVLAVFPCTMLAARCLHELLALPSASRVRFAARVVVLCAVTFAHLFVGLGHFVAGKPWGFVKHAGFSTHDGFMPTGGLLYHSARRGKEIVASPRFGARDGFYVASTRLFASWQENPAPRRVTFVMGSFPTASFYFHAQVAGCQVLDDQFGPEPFGRPTRLVCGQTQMLCVANWFGDLERMETIPMEAGDALWLTEAAELSLVKERLPRGLDLLPTSTRPLPGVQEFEVRAAR